MEDQSVCINFKVTNGKLLTTDALQRERFNAMLKANEGKTFMVTFIPESKADSSYIAKIHAMISSISKESGQDFDSVKDEIKKNCNFFVMTRDKNGNNIKQLRSFAKASNAELSFMIEYAYYLGDMVNLNLRKSF